ncbi:MAG: phospholipase, partial [Deltaproteobacteria bacterium CG_4_10_14_3_um_filter_60_8]
CFIGSHNLTHAALAYNHELSLRLDSPELAGQLLDYMKEIR